MHRWLEAHVSDVEESLPPFSVQLRLESPVSGLSGLRPVVGGIVNTERGQCYVELVAVTQLPRARQRAVAEHAESRRPAVFNVRFRTTDYPEGIHLQFDAMDFLEAVVQEYLSRRPEELPLARAPR